jgi:hypothetical protein
VFIVTRARYMCLPKDRLIVLCMKQAGDLALVRNPQFVRRDGFLLSTAELRKLGNLSTESFWRLPPSSQCQAVFFCVDVSVFNGARCWGRTKPITHIDSYMHI